MGIPWFRAEALAESLRVIGPCGLYVEDEMSVEDRNVVYFESFSWRLSSRPLQLFVPKRSRRRSDEQVYPP